MWMKSNVNVMSAKKISIGDQPIATLEAETLPGSADVKVPLIKIACHGYPLVGDFTLTSEKTRAMVITTFPITNNMHDEITQDYVTDLCENFFKDALSRDGDINRKFEVFKADVSMYMIKEAYDRFPEILQSHIDALDGEAMTPKELKELIESIKGDLGYINYIRDNPDNIISFNSYETGDQIPRKTFEVLASERSMRGVHGKIIVSNICELSTVTKNRGKNGVLLDGELLPQIGVSLPKGGGETNVTFEEILQCVTDPNKKNVPIVAVVDGSCNLLSSPTLAPIPATSQARIKLEKKTLLKIQEQNASVKTALCAIGDPNCIINIKEMYKHFNKHHPNSGVITERIAILERMIRDNEPDPSSLGKKKKSSTLGGSRKRRRTKRRRRPRARKTRRVYKRKGRK